MIKEFLEALCAISEQTGIYLTGTLKYTTLKPGELKIADGKDPYEARDVVPCNVGVHICRDTTGDFIVNNIEVIERPMPADIKRKAAMVVSDIEPYQSLVDGRMITSRSHHREHLRDNNLMEVGNERGAFDKAVREAQAPKRLTQRDVAEIFQKAESGGLH